MTTLHCITDMNISKDKKNHYVVSSDGFYDIVFRSSCTVVLNFFTLNREK